MNETTFEMIKSFAYGCTGEEIAALYNMTTEEAKQYRAEYAEEINGRLEELQKGGYVE